MTIGQGTFSYEWINEWARVPDSNRDNGRTHGVAVARDGTVYLFNQGNPAVLVLDANGQLLRSFGDYPGAHGLELAEENGREVLWVTDQNACVVQKLSTEGEVLQELPAPPKQELIGGDEPNRQKYIPTWATVAPDRDIWVGDGYGSHQVFRFGADGTYKGKIDGTEGAGRFREPHSVRFSPEGELWITDRSNLRVCVYDAGGRYLRHSDSVCHSPADFAFHDGHTYVAEIAGGVKVLDRELNVLASLGDNPEIRPNTDPGTWVPAEGKRPAGWPDLPRDRLHPGAFNTPHGIAVAPNGDIYVVEWILGGRITKLRCR